MENPIDCGGGSGWALCPGASFSDRPGAAGGSRGSERGVLCLHNIAGGFCRGDFDHECQLSGGYVFYSGSAAGGNPGNAKTGTKGGHAVTVASIFTVPARWRERRCWGCSLSPRPGRTVRSNFWRIWELPASSPSLGSAEAAPASGIFPSGVLVSNNSYVVNAASNTSADGNLDLNLRADWLVNKDNVTVTAGVALNSSSFLNATGLWSAFNVIAVRGNTSATPFMTSTANPSFPEDRLLPDVWQTSDSSFATGTVSGYAASLIGTAQELSNPDGEQNQVVKSLLMTGATRSGIDANGNSQNWTATTANHLDPLAGAGEANYSNSLSVLNGGERKILTVASGQISVASAGTVSTSPAGWTYGLSSAGGKTAILIDITSAEPGFVATLNWDVTPATNGNGTLDMQDVLFPHLGLELVPVSLVGSDYVLHNTLLDPGLISTDGNDNIQSLIDPHSLGAGIYALEVTGDASLNVDYGLSYEFESLPATSAVTAVPEPGAVALIAGAGVLLLRRRGKKVS